jgi:hypothetical protein
MVRFAAPVDASIDPCSSLRRRKDSGLPVAKQCSKGADSGPATCDPDARGRNGLTAEGGGGKIEFHSLAER